MANTGFTTLVNGVETDLIKIFDPLTGTDTKLTYNTNYVTSDGKDLTDIFKPYVAGDASAVPTKYTTLSGGLEKDLNVIFAKMPVPFPTASNRIELSSYQYDGRNPNYVMISGKNVIAGAGSGIWYSNDFGKLFTKSTSDILLTSNGYLSVAIDGLNAVACGGNNAGPFIFVYSRDAGITWSKSTITLPTSNFSMAYYGMCLSGTRAAGVVTSNATLYVSTNTGVSYTPVTTISNCQYVTMDSTNYYYVVTTGGVYRCGIGFNTATFTRKNTLTSTTITSISADLTNNVVMFSTNDGVVWYSINNGDLWSSIQLSNNLDVVCVSGNNAIAGDNNKTDYYVSKNAGTTWTRYTNSTLSLRNRAALSISGKNAVAGINWEYVVMYGAI